MQLLSYSKYINLIDLRYFAEANDGLPMFQCQKFDYLANQLYRCALNPCSSNLIPKYQKDQKLRQSYSDLVMHVRLLSCRQKDFLILPKHDFKTRIISWKKAIHLKNGLKYRKFQFL